MSEADSVANVILVIGIIVGVIIWLRSIGEKIQQNTCPKCGDSDNDFKDIKKSYDKRTDKVRYYQYCLGCGYTKYKDEPTTNKSKSTVNDFIDILDKQFENWEKETK